MRSLAFVEQSDLFKGLTSQQMKSVADSFTEKTYKANEIIIAEDDEYLGVFVNPWFC